MNIIHARFTHDAHFECFLNAAMRPQAMLCFSFLKSRVFIQIWNPSAWLLQSLQWVQLHLTFKGSHQSFFLPIQRCCWRWFLFSFHETHLRGINLFAISSIIYRFLMSLFKTNKAQFLSSQREKRAEKWGAATAPHSDILWMRAIFQWEANEWGGGRREWEQTTASKTCNSREQATSKEAIL